MSVFSADRNKAAPVIAVKPGAASSDGRLHPSDRANATTQPWRVNVQAWAGTKALSTLLGKQAQRAFDLPQTSTL